MDDYSSAHMASKAHVDKHLSMHMWCLCLWVYEYSKHEANCGRSIWVAQMSEVSYIYIFYANWKQPVLQLISQYYTSVFFFFSSMFVMFRCIALFINVKKCQTSCDGDSNHYKNSLFNRRIFTVDSIEEFRLKYGKNSMRLYIGFVLGEFRTKIFVTPSSIVQSINGAAYYRKKKTIHYTLRVQHMHIMCIFIVSLVWNTY